MVCSKSTLARALLAGSWCVVCAMIVAAPILSASGCQKAASVLYLSFAFICHQIPERSFMFSGHSLAVCHRCFGIYLGLFLGSFIENRFAHRSLQARRIFVLAATVPMLLDALLSHMGLWAGTGVGRFFTGFFFGILISALLVSGVAEFMNEALWRRFAIDGSHFEKGLS
jgi:uncharacterized membrane protein